MSTSHTQHGSQSYPVAKLDSLKDKHFEDERNQEIDAAILEQKQRFEQHMSSLAVKQQHEDHRGDSTGVTTVGLFPATPVKTPVHPDARSRASTLNRITPPAKGYDGMYPLNEQLATPPSDELNRAGLSAFAARSVPGSRRTSGSLAFENLNLSENNDGRRLSYVDRAQSGSKKYSEDAQAKQYLELNCNSDSFPILVRRQSQGFQGLFPPEPVRRYENYVVLPQSTPRQVHNAPVYQRNGHDGMDQHAAEQSYGGMNAQYYESDPRKHATGQAMRSPLGTLPTFSTNMHSPLPSPNMYNPYAVLQSNYPPNHNFASFPLYGMPSGHDQAAMTKSQNPYFPRTQPGQGKRPAEDPNRYAEVSLESLKGDIFSLCKDQHGCRYLQKKLDERNASNTDMIFTEMHMHAPELMIDPFGNYLCQKLFEHCNDDQRLQIVRAVVPDLVNISLNMHGTRAVQKMFEYLNTPEQIKLATKALDKSCVVLVKDLNGNHVIQRCLNRLSSHDNQFIYDAVSRYCAEIACHRHGCCVMQRCIDHASDRQKEQVIKEIIQHAPQLVQDPFGNYVVQYVLDLGDVTFNERLIRRFLTHICKFSVQKFSSNVIEKCLRVADPATRALVIQEMLQKSSLEGLLRDSYANYVIQTALDYADSTQRQQLIDCIKPILPAIRSTPYGRRIQSKINAPVGVGSFGAVNFEHQIPHAGFQPHKFPSMNGPPFGISNFQNTFRSDYD